MNKPSATTTGRPAAAGTTRQITITLPVGVHDDLRAAALVFDEDVAELVKRVVLAEHADSVECHRIGEIMVTTRYYKTRAAAERAAKKADAFDQEQKVWRFFRCSSGWFANYRYMGGTKVAS